ncbi:MAG TPA: ABC transporter substrate-binding protein [Burkholderiales bacterium]
MRRLLAGVAAAAMVAFGAHARTFTWTSQGDPQTSDPHSQNEGVTNLFSQQVYGTLVTRDKQLGIVPGLAVSWTQVNDTNWRFSLRQGVKFSDGTPFTADDVVFSIERAQHEFSQLRQYANLLGRPRKIDEHTVELVQQNPNPILLEHATTIFIMSKAWSVKHKVETPLDYKSGQDSYAARHAMGAGPWLLVVREPDVKTVLRRNPHWWGKYEGNVTEIIYRPIKSDATRTAALFSGQVDFVLDPPPQDIGRLKAQPGLKVVEGTENRIIFLGFDQYRDELLYSNVKGRNPFKDKRVRQAVYHAIDIDALRAKTMRGLAAPTGGITPSLLPSTPQIEKRLPYDPARARRLLAEAGYPNGFEVGLHCPNNRYIKDEELCAAVAAMLARVGIQVKLTTQPRATYFPRLEKYDTSFYLLGWGGAVTDAQTMLSPVLRSYDKATGQGSYNYGRYADAKLDALIDAAAQEMNPEKRRQTIHQALAVHNANVYHVPLHRQVIPWAMRANVNVVHRADNWLIGEWITVGATNHKNDGR